MKGIEYFPFYRQLDPEGKKLMEQAVFEREVKKGEMVYDGVNCLGLTAVVQGTLRAYTISEEGKEITLYRLFAHDVCLFAASCKMRNVDFEIMVSAKEDTKIAVLPADVFEKFSKTSIAFANYMNELLSSRFSDVMWIMDQVMNKSIDKRLAAFLLEEAQMGRKEMISITHEQAARELGTAREVITRMLKHLQDEGLIRISRGAVEIIDFDGLFALAKESIR